MSLASEELREELEVGERLLWSGQPLQGVRLRASDIFMIPFSLMWGGFAFFWEFTAIKQGAPLFFLLWGIPFVLMGIYIIIGRFFADSRLRSRTFYGVTDRRVIIIEGAITRNVRSAPLQGITDFSLSERADKSGSITFSTNNIPFYLRGAIPMQTIWSGTPWPGTMRSLILAFDLIADVRKVYKLIREAQQTASGPRPS